MTTRSRGLWWAVALAALAGLLLSVVVSVRGGPEPAPDVVGDAAVAPDDPGDGGAAEPPAPPPAPARAPGAPPEVARADASVAALAPRRARPPVGVRVPSLGLDATVRPVGVARDRQMQLPADPRVLGWYRYGPAPGQRGSVVVAGHVDSREYGVGPLAALQTVEPGARVEVVTAAGRTRTYRVDSVQRFDRQALPAEVFSRSGPERLRLVTCTGAYLPEAGGYQQNLVVTALPA